MPFEVSLLDYGAGNVRSVRNAILACGDYTIRDITTPSDILSSNCIIFPGVGSYGNAMRILSSKGYVEPLKDYLKNHDRPYLGICLGMQTLFDDSEENDSEMKGLGVVPGTVVKFDDSKTIVPHIGWNGRLQHATSPVLNRDEAEEEVYFVHSYYAPLTKENEDWVLTSTTYGGVRFVSAVQKGCVVATQFHPEKSGVVGLDILKGFLEAVQNKTLSQTTPLPPLPPTSSTTSLVKRLVVALDVRTNDHGDLVVTKGDQYDVRESHTEEKRVRNLGKPVGLAGRYYDEGADEIAFLNITSFRSGVLDDMPMLGVLEESSKSIFVPLTVGGGIRSYTCETTGREYTALEVASRYFRAGADKVSIGSDAVYAAESYLSSQKTKTGTTSIEQISKVYGVQAVVVSIDPQRVYLPDGPTSCPPSHVPVALPPHQRGPKGEECCWYRCTVKGGRESRDICAVTVAKAVEDLGAGEIMLNCIDMDGQGNGYDLALMTAVSNAVRIPVIASSGAGTADHFVEVFKETNVQAALAAGMFHRKEVEIEDVKERMEESGVRSRRLRRS